MSVTLNTYVFPTCSRLASLRMQFKLRFIRITYRGSIKYASSIQQINRVFITIQHLINNQTQETEDSSDVDKNLVYIVMQKPRERRERNAPFQVKVHPSGKKRKVNADEDPYFKKQLQQRAVKLVKDNATTRPILEDMLRL